MVGQRDDGAICRGSPFPSSPAQRAHPRADHPGGGPSPLPFAFLLPVSAGVGPRRRRAAALAAAVLLASLGVHLAYTTLNLGEGSDLVDAIVNRWGQQVVMAAAVALCGLRVRRDDPDRRTWLALTVALGLWGLGNTYWNAVLYTVETRRSLARRRGLAPLLPVRRPLPRIRARAHRPSGVRAEH